MARPLDARDLEAVEAGDVERGMREIRRRAVAPDALGEAMTAQNLHRPRVDRGRARVIDDAVAAFDDKSLDPARAEIGSEGETDGPGTDDQDRDVLGLGRHDTLRLV